MVECNICHENIPNESDNSIKCGGTIHHICSECKFKLNETGNTTCPMCRSHSIKNPIARDIYLPLFKKVSKFK